MKIVHGAADSWNLLRQNRGLNLSEVPPHVQATTDRVFGRRLTPIQVAEEILQQVRQQGDEAIRRLAYEIEGVEATDLEVQRDSMAAARERVSKDVQEALAIAAARIRTFHEKSKINGWFDKSQGLGQVVNAVGSVGVYVPGGTAPLPSTLLMAAIPARVAGVEEVIVCTPGYKGGPPSDVTLVAAEIAEVDRVFSIGGAQAIAAMAYGTESVPAVDMICGPGNIFVTLAKKLLFGEVGIDGLYGPTETVIIADESANPTLCAADLLAQAEHDAMARPVLITTSVTLANEVDRETKIRVERLDRREIARAAMENQGCIAVVDTIDEAVELTNKFAPEHCCLMVRDPQSVVGKIRNAGAIFLGEFSHEVLGDYVAGPSHVMPTAGTARFNSGLGVHSFVKISPVVGLDESVSRELAKAASVIARAEGLTGHAEAAEIREELR